MCWPSFLLVQMLTLNVSILCINRKEGNVLARRSLLSRYDSTTQAVAVLVSTVPTTAVCVGMDAAVHRAAPAPRP